MARVRRGALADNPYARAAAAQLEALSAYARREHRTLRIYPHPLERRLRESGVEPPYAALADGETVDDRRAAPTPRRDAPCTRRAVAVSLQSSFIWERLDLGLDDSFLLEFADPTMNVFERAALGRYAENVCRDNDELIAKVDAALRRGVAQRPLISPCAAADLPALRRRPARASSGTASSPTGSPSRLTPP